MKHSDHKLRVVQLISSWGKGGTETVLSAMGGRYPPDTTSVLIVNFCPGDATDAWWRRHGANYLSYPEKAPTLQCTIRLFRILLAERPHVVDLYGLRMDILGRIVARLMGVPVVVSAVRGTDNWRRWYHVWVDRITSRFVDCYISNSRAGSEIMGRRERIPENKRTVVYSGVDLKASCADRSRQDILASLGISTPNLFLFLTAARFHPLKGYQVLVKGISEFRDEFEGCLFLFAGKGNDREPTEKLARDLGVNHLIRFLGERNDVPVLMTAVDAFVLPSFYEGLPRSVIEAMAARLPVIATRVSGTPEVVLDGVTGLLVPAGDSHELGKALVRIRKDPVAARQMGRAGLERARELYDIDRAVADTVAVYRRLLAAKTPWWRR